MKWENVIPMDADGKPINSLRYTALIPRLGELIDALQTSAPVAGTDLMTALQDAKTAIEEIIRIPFQTAAATSQSHENFLLRNEVGHLRDEIEFAEKAMEVRDRQISRQIEMIQKMTYTGEK